MDVVVADESGRPVAGARVEAFAQPRVAVWNEQRVIEGWDDFLDSIRAPTRVATATTDAKGAAHVEGLAFGANALVVSKPGLARRRHAVTAPGTDGPVCFELFAGHALEGRVLTEDGRPVAGATVVAVYDGANAEPVENILETASPFDPWTRTDAAGRWRFDALPEGEVGLAAFPPGTWNSRIDRIWLPGVTRYDFVLDRHEPLAGTVRDKATGAPVPGAVVELEGGVDGGAGLWHGVRTRVVADERGRWSLSLSPPGLNEARIDGQEIRDPPVADGRCDLVVERVPPEPAAAQTARAWIRGVVVDGDGRPMSVEIRRAHGDGAVTRADGTFELAEEETTKPVRVWAVDDDKSWVTGEATPATTADAAVPLVLRWPRGPRETFHVTGVVRPPDGAKLVRPRVRVGPFEDLRRERWTTAAPDGRFDVEAPTAARDSLRLFATADGCGVATVAKPEPGVEVKLPRGATLRGHVLGEGAPLGRATVRLMTDDWGMHGEQQPSTAVAVTADDGTFAAAALPSEGGVLVESPGYVSACAVVERTDGGAASVDFDLAKRRELRGVVRWPDGRPVDGAYVSCELVGRTSEWKPGAYECVKSDAAGAFTARGLSPGRFDLLVTRESSDGPEFLATEVAGVESGGPTTTVVVRVGATLRGHVVDARGAPVAGADVRVEPRGERKESWLERTATSTADGTFELRALDDGVYALAIRARGLTTVRDVLVRADAKDLRLVLPDGVLVEGVLVDPAGAPLADRVVVARRLGTNLPELDVETRTDATGRFTLAGLDPGTTYVRVADLREAKRWLATWPRYVVAPAGDARIVVLAERSLVGSVWEGDVDSLRHRLPGVRVRVDVEGRTEPIVTVTDGDGVFAVGGLPDARCTIHAELDGYEEVVSPTTWPGGICDDMTGPKSWPDDTSRDVVLRRKSAK